MKTKKSMTRFLAMGLVFLVVGFFSSEAFPWGFATHAYIADHLGKTKKNQNADEIYGSVAPDTFNYLFTNPDYLGYLSDQTHAEFTKLWNASNQGLGKSWPTASPATMTSGERIRLRTIRASPSDRLKGMSLLRQPYSQTY